MSAPMLGGGIRIAKRAHAMRSHKGRRQPVLGLLGATGVAAAAMLSGCGGGGGAGGGVNGANRSPMTGESDPVIADAATPSTVGMQDAAVLDAMINYSQFNCMIADAELSHGTRPEVQQLAEKIRRREGVNIEFLMSERARLGVSRPVPNFLDDPRAADSKRRLDGLSGPAVDEFFVEHMIRYRLEIAKLAESGSTSVESANLRYFCRRLADDAGPELRELRWVQTEEYAIPANARAGSKGYRGSR